MSIYKTWFWIKHKPHHEENIYDNISSTVLKLGFVSEAKQVTCTGKECAPKLS